MKQFYLFVRDQRAGGGPAESQYLPGGILWLLLAAVRKHTFFMLNRVCLLFSLVISFVIPAVELHETVTITIKNTFNYKN